MSVAELFAKLRRYDRNAEVIFDEEEPVGQATDLVMPRRRWFRGAKNSTASQPIVPARFSPRGQSLTSPTAHDSR